MPDSSIEKDQIRGQLAHSCPRLGRRVRGADDGEPKHLLDETRVRAGDPEVVVHDERADHGSPFPDDDESIPGSAATNSAPLSAPPGSGSQTSPHEPALPALPVRGRARAPA